MRTTHRPGSASAPSGLPFLAAGAHLVPEDGSCLMEYASVLAGEPFSDTPRCTDPLLATLARQVNDATTDDGRPLLATLAPDLATAARTDAVGSAGLVLSALLPAHEALGRPRAVERHVRRARRRLRRVSGDGITGRVTRWLEPAHRSGSGRRRLVAAVDATARLPGTERDAVLRAMLDAALTGFRVRQPAPGSVAAVVHDS